MTPELFFVVWLVWVFTEQVQDLAQGYWDALQQLPEVGAALVALLVLMMVIAGLGVLFEALLNLVTRDE